MDTFSCAPTAGVLHAKMVNLSRRRVFQDQTDIFLCIVIVIIHYLHLCHQIEQLQRGTIVKTTRLVSCGAGVILEVNHLAIQLPFSHMSQPKRQTQSQVQYSIADSTICTLYTVQYFFRQVVEAWTHHKKILDNICMNRFFLYILKAKKFAEPLFQ